MSGSNLEEKRDGKKSRIVMLPIREEPSMCKFFRDFPYHLILPALGSVVAIAVLVLCFVVLPILSCMVPPTPPSQVKALWQGDALESVESTVVVYGDQGKATVKVFVPKGYTVVEQEEWAHSVHTKGVYKSGWHTIENFSTMSGMLMFYGESGQPVAQLLFKESGPSVAQLLFKSQK